MAEVHEDRAEGRHHRPSAQARRDALLRAAVEVAAELGTAAVTHRAVTERAGVPLATASYFFSSIDELVAEALRTFVADEAARLSELATRVGRAGPDGSDGSDGSEGAPDPDAMAAALSDAAMPSGPLPWALAQFESYLQAARDDAMRRPVAEALEVYQEVATAALEAAGTPADRATAEVARAFIALADGFSLHHLARPRPDDVDALRRALVLLYRGLLAEASDAAPERGAGFV
jgi:DNA-binding transcriptional regulator YbjK